jgi:hypothetical protein
MVKVGRHTRTPQMIDRSKAWGKTADLWFPYSVLLFALCARHKEGG